MKSFISLIFRSFMKSFIRSFIRSFIKKLELYKRLSKKLYKKLYKSLSRFFTSGSSGSQDLKSEGLGLLNISSSAALSRLG